MGEMPIFAGFWAIGPMKPAIGAGLASSEGSERPARQHERIGYFRPKSTFLLGASEAAIGVFSASTTGVATLK